MSNRFAGVRESMMEHERKQRALYPDYDIPQEDLLLPIEEEQLVWADYRDKEVADHMKVVAKAFGMEDLDDEQT